MLLNTHEWGPEKPERIVCIHGLSQHAGVFDALGQQLAAQGHSVLGVDLRGHGGSGSEPPWSTETHVRDVIETLGEHGVERTLLIGHSFGGRVAATLAAADPERTRGLALLETPHQVPPIALCGRSKSSASTGASRLSTEQSRRCWPAI